MLGQCCCLTVIMLRVALLLSVLSSVLCQVPGLWKCPAVPTKANFDVKKYVGRWYEIERYFPIFFELGVKCGQATYGLQANNTISVTNMGVSKITGEKTMVVGSAYAPDPSEPAKLRVTFPHVGAFSTGPYWVLDTDYTSYSVVYSCDSLDGIAHADIVWILGRERSMDDAKIKKIREVIASLGLRIKMLYKVSQDNCPF